MSKPTVQWSSSMFVQRSRFFFFMAPFRYASFSISDGDFSSKTQNYMFVRCPKDDISKFDEWKIRFTRNDLQLRPTVPKMNFRWLCVFLILVANLQNEHLHECGRPYREFIDSTSYIILKFINHVYGKHTKLMNYLCIKFMYQLLFLKDNFATKKNANI